MSTLRSLFYKWKSDYNFKTLTNSVGSLAITTVFAIYNGYLGIRALSLWHGSICVYYILLVIIRGTILLTERRSARLSRETALACRRRAFLFTSIALLVLNLALIAPISLMVQMKRPVAMGLIPAISMAAYATWKIIMASVNLKRKSISGAPLVRELRTINFIDALVSILTLQNTLIMVNQGGDDRSMLKLTAAVSAGVLLCILAVTILNLCRSGNRDPHSAGAIQ